MQAQIGARHQSVHKGIMYILLSLPGLLVWVIISMAQLKTDEAPYSGGERLASLSPDWSLLWQLPNLISGHLAQAAQAGAIAGWVVFTFYLLCCFGHAAAVEFLKHWPVLAKGFFWAIIGVGGWEVYTDIRYGMPIGSSDIWGIAVFTLISIGGGLFLGVICIGMLVHGLYLLFGK